MGKMKCKYCGCTIYHDADIATFYDDFNGETIYVCHECYWDYFNDDNPERTNPPGT